MTERDIMYGGFYQNIPNNIPYNNYGMIMPPNMMNNNMIMNNNPIIELNNRITNLENKVKYLEEKLNTTTYDNYQDDNSIYMI